MYQPAIAFEDRPEHPFAEQFTNYWAWRFDDALEALAATAGPKEFQSRILTVADTLASSLHESLAPAWRAFVTRKIGELTAHAGPHLMGQRDGLGGPGTDHPPFASSLPTPTGPYMRDVRSRPAGLPPAADVLVPPGWVAEPAGSWDGLEVDVVYDPRSHEIHYTPAAQPNHKAELEAAGWQLVAADRHRSFWARDRTAATRTALARVAETATSVGAGRGAAGNEPVEPDVAERSAYEAGQRVRWKQRGRNWRYGHLGDPPVERDGSLRVFEENGSGSARSLRPSGVEQEIRGPRGGRKWAPYAPAESPSAPHGGGVAGGRSPAARGPNPPARANLGLGR